jgi:serine/threonine-protein kinase
MGLPLDRRSDVFSLGIVLFELCTARRLFKRATPYDSLQALVTCDVPPPRSVEPTIDVEVEQVILRALGAKPDDRYPNAGEMQDALEAAMRKASLRAAAIDLERFVQANFAPEIAEQQELLLLAQRGEIKRNSTDSMLALADPGLDSEPEHEPPAAATIPETTRPPSVEVSAMQADPPEGPREDDPPPARGQRVPPLYYVVGALSATVIGLIVWIILRR